MARRILYVQFGDPAAYPPLEHSSQILAERGWDVVLLGTNAFGVQNLKLSPHARIQTKSLSLAKSGGRLSVQYIVFFFWCLYWTYIWRPDWIYASDPLAIPAVWLIRIFTRTRTVYHEHDSPVGESGRSWFMKTVLACRARLARRAELCIFPQQGRLDNFLRMTGRQLPTICVWNCPRVSELQVNHSNDESEKRTLDETLIVYYHGSINRERLPAALVVAASRFNGAIRIRIAGYEVPGSIGYVDALIKLAAESGAPRIVEFLGVISPHKELLQSAAKAHIGLSLMPKSSNDINLRLMVGASNKAFDCMASGLPLLVSDLPEWTSTFVEPGFARACDPADVDSIEAQFRWYLRHPNSRREMGRRCVERIKRSWNYDTMFADVVTMLERN